jgi:hypothetical protein
LKGASHPLTLAHPGSPVPAPLAPQARTEAGPHTYENNQGTATHTFRAAARERAGTSLQARLKRAAELAKLEKQEAEGRQNSPTKNNQYRGRVDERAGAGGGGRGRACLLAATLGLQLSRPAMGCPLGCTTRESPDWPRLLRLRGSVASNGPLTDGDESPLTGGRQCWMRLSSSHARASATPTGAAPRSDAALLESGEPQHPRACRLTRETVTHRCRRRRCQRPRRAGSAPPPATR